MNKKFLCLILAVILSSIMFSSCFQLTNTQEANKKEIDHIIEAIDKDIFDAELIDIAPPFNLYYRLKIDEEKFLKEPKYFIDKINNDILLKIEEKFSEKFDIPHLIQFSVVSKNSLEELFLINMDSTTKNSITWALWIEANEKMSISDIENLKERIIALDIGSKKLASDDSNLLLTFPKLESLSGIVIDDDQDFNEINKLKNLNLICLDIKGHINLNQLSPELNITKLIISGYHEENYKKIDFTALKNLSKLKYLDICSSTITEQEKTDIKNALSECDCSLFTWEEYKAKYGERTNIIENRNLY